MRVSSKTVLKELAGANRVNGLALVSLEQRAWYVYDQASVESADDDNILMPTDGVGRWYKCNNESNVLNSMVTVASQNPSTTVDFSNNETVQLILNNNCSILLPNTLRNGQAWLVVNRNGGSFNITSWDSQFVWPSTPYTFTSANLVILSLVCLNNLAYVTNITEY